MTPPKGCLYSGATPAQVAADLQALVTFQSEGMAKADLESLLTQKLLPHLMRYDLPQFQSMFNATPPPEAKMGALIAMDFNQGVTNWQVSPGGAVLEELCCQALCRLFGLGADADATFMYSGTYANQQALYMALHRHAQRQGFDYAQKGLTGFPDPSRLAVLVSEDAHFSLRHAVRILGLGEESLVAVPVDVNRRIDIRALHRILPELKASRDIFCIVATAGTTSVGAIDPIDKMADTAAQMGAWLHVDGAYGYAYKLVPEFEKLFAGDERADSITWDPHKQLGAPIPNSILFVKDSADFRRMALYSSYFNRREDEIPNPGLKSPPSTRPMAALPLVTLLRGRGLKQVVEDLRHPLDAVQSLAHYLLQQPEVDLLTRPDLGIVCFRMTPQGYGSADLNPLQESIYRRMTAEGQHSIAITQLDGRNWLRLVVVAPNTTTADLRATFDALRLYLG